MNNNDTTIKHNPIALAQSELDMTWSAFEQAQKDYKANHSDANLQALESARAKFIRVENEMLEARQMLIVAAAMREASTPN